MKAYKYIVDECDPFEYASCFNSDWDEEDADYIAKDAADHYYSESAGGWKWNESISIEVFKEDGTSLGVFDVGYDLEPQFWVSQEEPVQPSCSC